jgi:hypothetical protein
MIASYAHAVMPLDNIIFPKPFSLPSRNEKAVCSFQMALFNAPTETQPYLEREIMPAGTKILRNVPQLYPKTRPFMAFRREKVTARRFHLRSRLTKRGPFLAAQVKARGTDGVENFPRLTFPRAALNTSLDL